MKYLGGWLIPKLHLPVRLTARPRSTSFDPQQSVPRIGLQHGHVSVIQFSKDQLLRSGSGKVLTGKADEDEASVLSVINRGINRPTLRRDIQRATRAIARLPPGFLPAPDLWEIRHNVWIIR